MLVTSMVNTRRGEVALKVVSHTIDSECEALLSLDLEVRSSCLSTMFLDLQAFFISLKRAFTGFEEVLLTAVARVGLLIGVETEGAFGFEAEVGLGSLIFLPPLSDDTPPTPPGLIGTTLRVCLLPFCSLTFPLLPGGSTPFRPWVTVALCCSGFLPCLLSPLLLLRVTGLSPLRLWSAHGLVATMGPPSGMSAGPAGLADKGA
mmetsp:Transcript_5808/g.11642  ORF Transcript_5808/g.11642 Transcript_5808/m.11642 type:complete len:204 (-) Transcript_5808:1535-2146(-)